MTTSDELVEAPRSSLKEIDHLRRLYVELCIDAVLSVMDPDSATEVAYVVTEFNVRRAPLDSAMRVLSHHNT